MMKFYRFKRVPKINRDEMQDDMLEALTTIAQQTFISIVTKFVEYSHFILFILDRISSLMYLHMFH